MSSLYSKVFSLLLFSALIFFFVFEPLLTIQKSIIIFSQISFALLIFTLISQKKIIFPTFVLVPAFFFLIWLLTSSFFSLNKEDSTWEVLKYFSLFNLFLVFYNFSLIAKEKVSKFFLYFSIVSSLVIFRDFIGFLIERNFKDLSRFSGSLSWHNQMAGFLIFLIPVSFYFLISEKSNLKKIFFGFILIIQVVSFFLSYSRGAWLSLFLSLILFSAFFLKYLKSYYKFILTALAALILFFTLLNPFGILDRALSIKEDVFSSTRSVSGSLRTTVWENSLRMIQEYPLFGVGPGVFGAVYDSFQKDPWLYSKYAHNYFLELAVETGIAGIMLYSSILASFLYVFLKNRKKITKNPFLTAISISLLASFIHAFLDINFSRITLYSLFFIFFAALISFVKNKQFVLEINKRKQIFYFLPLGFMIVSLILNLGENNYQKAKKNYANFEFKKAEVFIKKSLFFNPFSARSYYLLGQIYEQEKKWKEAKISYKKAISIAPYTSKYYYKLGSLFLNEENYKEAEEKYLGALKFAPYGNLDAYLGLATLYSKTKQFKKEQKIIDKAVYEAFPINKAYKGFEYLYIASGFKEDMINTYIKFAVMEINLKNNEKALKILDIIRNDLDPKNSNLPFLLENVVK